MIGEHLGSYKIIEEIGKGGMGAVYRAYQPSIDRDVAIKVIHAAIATDDDAIMRFQREARLIARLEHIHLLPVYDFDGAHDPPYIVMRYLEGGTLKDILKQGLLPIDEVLYILRQIAAAIDYAHRQGIVHRDIKPSNIMIDREGNAFVTDFGIARIIGGDTNSTLTQRGVTVGTPDYMAPEQGMGAVKLDHRVDIYSLAVMIYEMIAGQLPYQAELPMQVILKHVQEPIPNILEYNAELPEYVDLIMRRALAKEPDDRYDSASELVNTLATALNINHINTPTVIREAARDAHTMLLKRQKDTATQTLQQRQKTHNTSAHTQHNQIVTAMYINASEYMQMVDELNGPQAAHEAMITFLDNCITLIAEYGGKTFSRSENTLLALWGTEEVHENDAEQTIHAALAIQKTLREIELKLFTEDEDEPLPINIGIHTGLALLTPSDATSDYAASGATISITNRLTQNALGMILISHDTYRLVQGVFDIDEDAPLKIRGRKNPLQTYQVIAAKARAFRVWTRSLHGVETDMIGRRAELERLQNTFDDAAEEAETQVITIVGGVGIGKSRLLYEFSNWIELANMRVWMFKARATSTMTNRPYALLRDLISFRFEILDSDPLNIIIEKINNGILRLLGRDDEEITHMIGHLVGFDFSESPIIKGLLNDANQLSSRAKQLFKRLIIHATERQPMVIQLEDIHFADDASLNLINELVNENPQLRLMVIGLARPTLLKRRPTWGAGQDFHQQITLPPLSKRDSRNLVKEILKNVKYIPKQLRDLIVERSEGVPYFMEELIKMLIEDRIIIKGNDEWLVETSRLDNIRVPSTLAGLLQVRLNSLLQPERVLLERAAVVGRIFYDSAIKALDGTDEAILSDILPELLDSLSQREFIYIREPSALEGHKEYIFAQHMMRDTIYNNLLHTQLKTYHAHIADWNVEVAGDRSEEYLALIAEHYEYGEQYDKAAHYLALAGDKALNISALTEAKIAYEKAIKLVRDDTKKAFLKIQLSETLRLLGELNESGELLQNALNLSQKIDDLNLQANALYHLSQLATDNGDWDDALAYLGESLPLARDGDDRATLALVLYGLADTHFRLNNMQEAEQAGNESLQIAREIGDVIIELMSLNRLGSIKTWAADHRDFDDAEAMFLACVELARKVGNKEREAAALGNIAVIAAFKRDHEKSIQYTDAGYEIDKEIGNLRGMLISCINLAESHIFLNNIDEAKRLLVEAISLAKKLGSSYWLLATTETIGVSYIAQGNREHGLALVGLALRHHPSSAGDSKSMNEYITDYAELGHSMTKSEIETGFDKGKGLDLDEVIGQFLAEVNAHDTLQTS